MILSSRRVQIVVCCSIMGAGLTVAVTLWYAHMSRIEQFVWVVAVIALAALHLARGRL